jgi:hypothetical protein
MAATKKSLAQDNKSQQRSEGGGRCVATCRYSSHGSMSAAQITKLSFKSTPVVDFIIPFDAQKDDISARKMNQFNALSDAWKVTTSEGATGAWAALNSITRYVDHERSVKNSNGDIAEVRFPSLRMRFSLEERDGYLSLQVDQLATFENIIH